MKKAKKLPPVTNGIQFARYENFARSAPRASGKKISKGADYGRTRSGTSWNVFDILAEAARLEGHCDHVLHPHPQPRVLHGCDVLEVEDLADHYATTVTQSNGKPYRKDSPVMVAGVISFPTFRLSEWDEFKETCVEQLKELYGDRLRSVIEHLDEIKEFTGSPHLHFYCVPLDGEDFGTVDPAYKAAKEERKKSENKDGENVKKDKNGKKYTTGKLTKCMKEMAYIKWQDEIFMRISLKYDMLRTGPRRERWSREETVRRMKVVETNGKLARATEAEEKAAKDELKADYLKRKAIAQEQAAIEFAAEQKKLAEVEAEAIKNEATAKRLAAEEMQRKADEFVKKLQDDADVASTSFAEREAKLRVREVKAAEGERKAEVVNNVLTGSPSIALSTVRVLEETIDDKNEEIADLEVKLQEANKKAVKAEEKAKHFETAFDAADSILTFAIERLGVVKDKYVDYMKEKFSIVKARLQAALNPPKSGGSEGGQDDKAAERAATMRKENAPRPKK